MIPEGIKFEPLRYNAMSRSARPKGGGLVLFRAGGAAGVSLAFASLAQAIDSL